MYVFMLCNQIRNKYISININFIIPLDVAFLLFSFNLYCSNFQMILHFWIKTFICSVFFHDFSSVVKPITCTDYPTSRQAISTEMCSSNTLQSSLLPEEISGQKLSCYLTTSALASMRGHTALNTGSGMLVTPLQELPYYSSSVISVTVPSSEFSTSISSRDVSPFLYVLAAVLIPSVVILIIVVIALVIAMVVKNRKDHKVISDLRCQRSNEYEPGECSSASCCMHEYHGLHFKQITGAKTHWSQGRTWLCAGMV